MTASIRVGVGVGGWSFEPWRDNFYPSGWPRSRASRKLTAIEPAPASGPERDRFMFFIYGAKEKAPAAAMALLRRLA